MILPDSAIWIDHLRRPDLQLDQFLATDRVVGHPFVTGEVSLGSIATRDRVIAGLHALPQLRVATSLHVSTLIESHALWGRGIGYVDAHLLASCLLVPGTQLWTRDKRLQNIAASMDIALP